jgi:hypothetical protein
MNWASAEIILQRGPMDNPADSQKHHRHSRRLPFRPIGFVERVRHRQRRLNLGVGMVGERLEELWRTGVFSDLAKLCAEIAVVGCCAVLLLVAQTAERFESALARS